MYDEKPIFQRQFYTWSHHFINRCGYFSLWLIIFKYGMKIYFFFPYSLYAGIDFSKFLDG